MESKINQQTVRLFFDKLAKLFNYFFPGIIILELFFNKGYFSNPPTDTFGFILYIFWCGILSIPYNFIGHESIANFHDNLILAYAKKYKLDEEQSEEFQTEFKKEFSEDEIEDMSEEINLGLILVKLFLTYLVYKLLINFGFDYTILNIPSNVLQLFATLIITIPLSYPLVPCYTWICTKMIVGFSNKDPHQS